MPRFECFMYLSMWVKMLIIMQQPLTHCEHEINSLFKDTKLGEHAYMQLTVVFSFNNDWNKNDLVVKSIHKIAYNKQKVVNKQELAFFSNSWYFFSNTFTAMKNVYIQPYQTNYFPHCTNWAKNIFKARYMVYNSRELCTSY